MTYGVTDTNVTGGPSPRVPPEPKAPPRDPANSLLRETEENVVAAGDVPGPAARGNRGIDAVPRLVVWGFAQKVIDADIEVRPDYGRSAQTGNSSNPRVANWAGRSSSRFPKLQRHPFLPSFQKALPADQAGVGSGRGQVVKAGRLDPPVGEARRHGHPYHRSA